MNRALIFGIPLVALGVASWAAWQIQRLSPERSEAIIMMLPGDFPDLNPFFPRSEAERQILDLIHEPMIRLDSQGRLAPGLAKSWSWHQRVTCWFSTQDALHSAQRRLAEVPPETRQSWNLDEVTTQGLSLLLHFSKPGAPGTDAALQTLASESVLPLTFIRLDSPPSARLSLEKFAKSPEHAASSVRLWFDEDGACELVTTRPLHLVREELTTWLRQNGQTVPSITPMAEVAGLLEPVLDFKLNSTQHTWPDGSPVTAADIRATVSHVMQRGYPVPGREGFRHIQDITVQGSSTVRVTYRRSYGAALASWIHFPILPESWLKKAPEDLEEPPPGAGQWQASRTPSLLTLTPRAAPEGTPQHSLHAITATSSLQARVALATGTLDVAWPGDNSELLEETSLDFHPTQPRNRLLVLWNLRSSRLSELPVREALSLGLDRQSLLANGLDGQARLAEPLFMPGLWYAPKGNSQIFDLELARQKLETAGWLRDVSGIAKKGGQTLDFKLLVTTGNEQRTRLAHLLADQWSQLGARVTVTSVASEALVPEHLAPGKFDAVLLGLDYELAWDQTAFWHSGQIQAGLNFSRLADPQLDLLLESLASEYDTRQIPARARAVQDRFLTQQPALPLIGDLQQIGVRKARFPQLGAPDSHRPLTLRTLLQTASPQSLQMRVPNE
ncbi:ABC-type transport system substrate-binding protein [Prosthecobacter fusiformis]|uniref:ABC-type transport system substrate-binding protein n=1 Tax=Prosthecobacter fusiformis TaxID=48464 RepID=A0A4R7SR03_9BACT|nr:ABC transporter substrate-binding protein [Prosthecobacter fusiformis]TDU81680.1 ABC-type transport system substrate-binding protein [Prosthecobacter fusiformis]